MDQKLFSIGEAYRFGWHAFRNNIGIFILAELIAIVTGNIPVVGIVIGTLLHLGAVSVGLRLTKGEEIKFEDFFRNYKLFFIFLLASILAGLATFAGVILLVVPGVIIGITLSLYGYAIVDKNAGIIESLKISTALTKGRRWELFVFYLAGLGINILGMLALGIGLLATIPTTLMANAFVYRKFNPTDAV